MERSNFFNRFGEMETEIFEGVQDLFREALFQNEAFANEREWAEREIYLRS